MFFRTDSTGFHFIFVEGGLLIILINYMIFLFLDVKGMSMSTVSFLTQLDSGILFL